MKRAIFSDYAVDLSNLRVESDAPRPVANETHCVIQIHSASINPIDVKIAQGYIASWWPTTLPFVPGYDCAGVIIELPVGYTGGEFKVGDRVFTCNWGTSKHWDSDSTSQGGCFAELGLFSFEQDRQDPIRGPVLRCRRRLCFGIFDCIPSFV